jgi:hypothetical protein
MSPRSLLIPELVAQHLGGGLKTQTDVLRPEFAYSGYNFRTNAEGGMFPRPGKEDSGIDLSSYNITAGRGMLSAKMTPRLWLAVDDGSTVKILYVSTDHDSPFYGLVYDVGLSLQTGYYVCMLEFENDIYYGNGYNTNGRIITGELNAAVTAGDTSFALKTGQGIRFPTAAGPYTARCGTDVFTFTTTTSDTLSGVPASGGNALLAHVANEMITLCTTFSPTYCDKASILVEWLASLNCLADKDQKNVWEFSKFANAANLGYFYDFSAAPSSQELVGHGGEITAARTTKNFFIVWKKDGMYGTGRSEVSTTTGARIPSPIKPDFGTVNNRSVAVVGDDDIIFQLPQKRLARFGASVQNGEQTIGVDSKFDDDIEKDLLGIDTPDALNWMTFNIEEGLLKCGMRRNGAQEIWVRKYPSGEWFKDTGKNYDVVCEHDSKTWAIDGSAQKLYIDEVGNYDDIVPVEMERSTGWIGRDKFKYSKARYLHVHGYMTINSIAYIDVYYGRDSSPVTKTLTDDYLIQRTSGTPLGSGRIGSIAFGSGGDAPLAFPFRFPFGLAHKGEEFRVVIRTTGENGDFVQCNGFSLGLTPLSRFPHSHA